MIVVATDGKNKEITYSTKLSYEIWSLYKKIRKYMFGIKSCLILNYEACYS